VPASRALPARRARERGATVEVVDRGEARLVVLLVVRRRHVAPWCELESAEPLVARLGSESLAWWQERFPGMGGTSGTSMNGSLVVAHGREAGELAQFGRRTERFEWLDGEGIAALEPDLGGRSARRCSSGKKGTSIHERRLRLSRTDLASWECNPFWRHCGRRAADGGQRVGCGRVSCAVGLQDRRQTENAKAGDPSRARCVIDCTGLAARGSSKTSAV